MSAPKSTTTHNKTPAPEAPVAPNNPTNAIEPTDAVASTPPVANSLNGLIFPLAITVLAIFPLALGVGTARIKAAASSVQQPTAVVEEEMHEETPRPAPRPIDRRIADQLFLERRYEVALQYYQSLGSAEAERLPSELLYRIGLCQEGLGLWDIALERYSTVSRTTDKSLLKAAADFGQARIFLRMNLPEKAEFLLRNLELQQTIERPLPKNLSQEISFLYPLSLAHKSLSAEQTGTKLKPERIDELFIWSLEPALDWSEVPEQRPQDDRTVTDAVNPTNVLSCRLIRSKDKMLKTPPVEESIVEIRCTGQPVRNVVERMANACGWKLDWADLKNDPSLDQVVELAYEDRPISSILTVLCSEMKSTWSVKNNQLTVKRVDADGSRMRQMLSRTLESVVNWNPNNRHVNHCRFAMAQIAEADGELPKAALLFSSLVGRDTSAIAIRSAYNAGTIYFRTGDLSRACFHLEYAVSGASVSEMQTAALLLLGRIRLELGETQEAIFQFRRATEAVKQPAEQARAAAFLGMAYLMQEKYKSAGEAILAHRFLIDGSAAHNAASLANALARWKGLPEEQRESESKYLYRAVVAVKSEPESFERLYGQTGLLLMGQAYLELGFHDEMAEIYARLQSTGVTEFINSELSYSLANYDYLNGRVEKAMSAWVKLTNHSTVRVANRARMRLAELTLKEGHPEDCLKYCESIEASEGVARKDINRLMGKAYEMLGDEVQAARYYAGQTQKP